MSNVPHLAGVTEPLRGETYFGVIFPNVLSMHVCIYIYTAEGCGVSTSEASIPIMLVNIPSGTWLPSRVPESPSIIAILLLFCAMVESAVSPPIAEIRLLTDRL
jgi:hypothetical protein